MSTNLYKTDTNSVLRFYEEAAKNNFLSEQEGKPIFDNVLMCEIITPGQTATSPVVEIERILHSTAGTDAAGNRKVKRSGHYTRFKPQIEAYKNDTGEYLDEGTPIGSWSQIDRGTAETFKAQGIHTVEALASVNDSALGHLGTGARTMRDKAKSYILTRQFGVPDAQQAAELSKAKERIAELEAEVAEFKQLTSQKVAGEGTVNVSEAPVTEAPASEPQTI